MAVEVIDGELRGAAEEATMKAILKQLEQMNSNRNTPNNNNNSNDPTVTLGKGLKSVTVAFGLLGASIGLVTGLMGKLGKTAAGAVDMGTAFAATQPKVTDFTKSLSNLPWLLGDLGSAVHSVTELLYKNYTTFQQLSTSGIAFGDRIERMNQFAANVGVGLDTVAGNLAANSEALARLGTGTRGAEMAVQGMAEAFDMNSASLQRYGLSFEEQNEMYMRFFSMNSLAMQKGIMSQSQVNAMSGDYAKGLRRLSELTGIQADQLQEGVDRANMNRAFENFISNMEPEMQNRFRSIINTVQAGFGDAGREAAMSTILGIAPVTDAAADMMTINKDFSGLLSNINSSARGFTGTLDQFNNNLYGQMNQFANANRGYADANSRLFAMMDLAGDPLGQAGGQLVAGINMFSGSIDDIRSNLGAESPMAKAFRTFNEAIQKVREAFVDMLVNVFESDAFKGFVNTVAEKMPKVTEAIIGFLDDMQDPEKRQARIDRIFDTLAEGFHQLMLRLNDTVLGYFISNDGMREREQANLEQQYNAGDITMADLQDQAENAQFSPTREAAAALIQQVNNANALALEPEYNRLRDDVMRLDSLTGSSSRLPLRGSYATGYNWKDPVAVRNGAYDDLFEEMGFPNGAEDVAELMQLRDQLLPYRRGGSSTMFTRDPQMARRFAEDFGLEFRTRGTQGATGQFVEPRNTIAHLEAGEKVLTPEEVERYRKAGSGGGNMGEMARLIVDSNRENSVQLKDALNKLISLNEQNNSLTKQVISTVEQYS